MRSLILALSSLLLAQTHLHAQDAKPIPVIVDTDIGDDIDDAFALALALQSPELDLRGITTAHGDAFTRAQIVCRMLHFLERTKLPVASGRAPQATPTFDGQMQYGLRPTFRNRPEKDLAVPYLYRQFKEHPGELTLLTVGPLTNIAELFTKHPDCKPWIKRIVLMGGSVKIGYDGKKQPAAEWNIAADAKSARVVFESGVPLVVAPLDATGHLVLDANRRAKIFGSGPLGRELHALYQLWDKPDPVLYDPVAVALCFTEKFCTMEELHLTVDDKGFTRIGAGKPNARVAMSIQTEKFLEWIVTRLSAQNAPAPPATKVTNESKLVEKGNMPAKIHVIEDYETDIERRWWLAGKLETKDVPQGSKRACRGTLTNDFDDLQGDKTARYTAVIFNPVPGPPMGKHTRLSFRFKLTGATTLKVQLYTLSKGYHRHLTLTGLAEKSWQSATVDMTAARRRDGTGGPLSEDERIDDIQFYTDAGAELLIDDIVLYDAPAIDGERRPFPSRPIFTAWFDTGKQGKEWPGTFDIIAKEKPHSWKAAASVARENADASWIRLSLRGPRPLGAKTSLRFRYHLTGADNVQVVLVDAKNTPTVPKELKNLAKSQWAEMTTDVSGPSTASEIHFFIPRSARLLLDDVLLYEP